MTIWIAYNQISYIDYGKPAHTYSDTIQGFHRFLLEQLSSEGNNFPQNPLIVPSENTTPSMIAAPITQLLGLDVKTNIYCANCKGRRQKENMPHVTDLVFPKSVSVCVLFLFKRFVPANGFKPRVLVANQR